MSLENSIDKLTTAVEKLARVMAAKERETILATPPVEMKTDGDPKLITDEGVELVKPEPKKKERKKKDSVPPVPSPPAPSAPPKEDAPPAPPAPPMDEKISEADAVAIANRMKEVATNIGDAKPLWDILKKHGVDAVSSLLAKDVPSVSAMMEELNNG